MSIEPLDALLDAARAGNSRAFDSLVAPHRKALLAHCYRMLASASDAEDAVQETLVRAWTHLRSFEGRAALRTWLFRIATRACLDALERRAPRRFPGMEDTQPASPEAPLPPPVLDPVWLEPLPDARWCEGPLDEAEGPEAQCTRRQSVAVAFLAALQLLPASQRAALLLHEVAGWRAAEIAEALESTPTGVHSALQRARASLDERAPGWQRRPVRADALERAALERYLRAWNQQDPAALAAALREDAVLAMPPSTAWFQGRDAVARFFARVVLSLPFHTVLAPGPGTNGQLTLVSYRRFPAAPEVLRADGLHLLSLDERGDVASIFAFLGEAPVRAHGLPVERSAAELGL